MRGMTDGYHFGMRGRMAIGQRAIAGTRDDLVTAHQHAADRHLAASAGTARLIECHIHKRGHFNSLGYRLVSPIHVFIHVSYVSKDEHERTAEPTQHPSAHRESHCPLP